MDGAGDVVAQVERDGRVELRAVQGRQRERGDVARPPRGRRASPHARALGLDDGRGVLDAHALLEEEVARVRAAVEVRREHDDRLRGVDGVGPGPEHGLRQGLQEPQGAEGQPVHVLEDEHGAVTRAHRAHGRRERAERLGFACVEMKSSTRLQCARIRPFRRKLFGCASRTRREQSIRPKNQPNRLRTGRDREF